MTIRKRKYSRGYEYSNRDPLFIAKEDLTDKQYDLLTKNESFCMMPWVHLHAFPDGRAYPCCMSDYWHPVGDLRKHTMREVWNQDPLKEMRRKMLNGEKCKECSKCYEREDNDFFSMRYESNRTYGHNIPDVDLTHEDGTHPEFHIRYWDVRFSNLCNMKCRSCGPIFSSQWYNDHVKLTGKKPDVLGREMARIEYAGGDEDSIIQQMDEHIPYLEQVYFAGGEPLIMKEHYYLLEKLIENEQFETCIQYNTNFSELRYKDKHVFDYWKHFRTVGVGASLDASGARGELMRKGTDWAQAVANRRLMMEKVPHVDFYIAATISAMNILHILDFHKEWVELGLIQPKDFNVNICQGPDWYRIDIFPEDFKNEVIIPAYERHLEWLEPQDPLERATGGFRGVLNMLRSSDGKQHFAKFKEEIAKYDNLRGEDFWATFPELAQFKDR